MLTSRQIQVALSAIFIVLGAWCVVAPGNVEGLMLRPEYQHQDATTHVLLGCFGAQAILAGTLLYLADLSPSAFLMFGLIGSIPFYIFFNWYFYFVQPMFTSLMLVDVLGNTGILCCGIAGYYLKKRELAFNAIA